MTSQKAELKFEALEVAVEELSAKLSQSELKLPQATASSMKGGGASVEGLSARSIQ